MLSALVLDNFKAFGTRQVIPMAPITLIFGANSSGKSSVLQSFLLLKQTLEGGRGNDAVLLPKGDLVDLGGFRQMIFAHEISRCCEISPLFTGMDKRLPLNLITPSHGPYGVGFRFSYSEKSKQVELRELPHYWDVADRPVCTLVPVDLSDSGKRSESLLLRHRYGVAGYDRFAECGEWDDRSPAWEAWFQDFCQSGKQETERRIEEIIEWVEATAEAPSWLAGPISPVRPLAVHLWAVDVNTRTLLRRASAHRSLDESEREEILAGLRASLGRFRDYTVAQFTDDVTAYNGARMVGLRNFLATEPAMKLPGMEGSVSYMHRPIGSRYGPPDVLTWSTRLSMRVRRLLDTLVYLGPAREYPQRHYIFSGSPARDVGKSGQFLPDVLFTRPSLVQRTNRVLKAFETGYELRLHQVKDPDVEDLVGLRLYDKQSKVTVSMPDVGFGISQVLPIIVQSMLSREQLILIEQPEVHLHPRLQAELGTLFSMCIGKPNDNQFLIETHSEHLILRLQRLIRKRELHPSDVSVIYVKKGRNGSRCRPLRLDEQGDFIDEWPDGFFEEGFREMFE